MRADYMVLADVVTAADGKLYIHGAGWDNVLTQQFPATLTAGVGILLRMPWVETNADHILELDIHDADGTSVLPAAQGPLRGKINAGRPPNLEVGTAQVYPLAISLNGTKIERPGQYAIVLHIDGEEAARAPFKVSQMPVVQAAAPPQEPPAGR